MFNGGQKLVGKCANAPLLDVGYLPWKGRQSAAAPVAAAARRLHSARGLAELVLGAVPPVHLLSLKSRFADRRRRKGKRPSVWLPLCRRLSGHLRWVADRLGSARGWAQLPSLAVASASGRCLSVNYELTSAGIREAIELATPQRQRQAQQHTTPPRCPAPPPLPHDGGFIEGGRSLWQPTRSH